MVVARYARPVRVLVPLLLILVLVAVAYWAVVQARRARSLTSAGRKSARPGRALQTARWKPAHRQSDGHTEVVLQRVLDAADGDHEVVEERRFDRWSDDDPMWEARFAEAMANARHRCDLMNAEEP